MCGGTRGSVKALVYVGSRKSYDAGRKSYVGRKKLCVRREASHTAQQVVSERGEGQLKSYFC